LNLAVFAIAFIFKCAYYVKRYNTCYIRHEPDVEKTIAGQKNKKTEIGGLIREFRLLTGLTQEQFRYSKLKISRT
jgi:hypothetical protein